LAEKTFINNSPATLQITLFIRQGNNPVNQDGTSSFVLNPGQSQTITYGDAQNIFLNGILLFTIFEGDLYSKIQFVTISGSELDDLLNTNDTITISKELTDYVISGSNPALVAVNNAQTAAEMRAAIENQQLRLDLTAYNSLSEARKDQAARTLLANRPVRGYPTAASVQVALNNAINSDQRSL